MSQEYANGKGKAPAPQDAEPDANNTARHPNETKFMTVGNGAASEHAARLQHLIDIDSGYGGSIAGDEQSAMTGANWDAPMHHERQSGVVHQIWYNRQRTALGRSINKVLELLNSLQETNTSWPAHYPSVQRSDLEANATRPGLQRVSTMAADAASSSSSVQAQPPILRRAMTSLQDSTAESSTAAERRGVPEPRLVSPQIAQEFSILKLDLKLGSLHHTELVHSLEKHSIAALLDGKIASSIKHLISLRERIEDTTSKVLITGDLNAGKSTFCNALLRRKLLPEDQQPCTAIFCEVLDARENAGLEEVHAVHKDAIYNRNDESTYDVFTLMDLEKIVVDSDTYTQCKIFVKDNRTIDQSLLNNGVVDIALIDAPGLNSNNTKTTAIFSRQEEIDVVVFVVSAANHFTQSATDFIATAASEKAYIFMVVNGYDNIRDKERCQKMILDQVGRLSPRTRKEADELVHFVSSNAIPVSPSPPGGPSGSGGGGGDDPDDSDKGKGKDLDKIRDFEALEQSLRRFVLEKRARSKLAPAKTYLVNILNDVNTLARVNQEVARSEIDRVARELRELEPQLESSKKARTEVDDQVSTSIEITCKEVYDDTRAQLTTAITESGNTKYDIPYPGLFGAFSYADDLKEAMLSQISEAVDICEDRARQRTMRGVNTIKQLGLLHIGDEFQNLHFKPEVMFRRKRDALARNVHISTQVWDFFDWSTILQKQEKLASTSMALTVAGAVVPRMMGMGNWMDQALTATKVLSNENLRQLILPGIVIAAVAASAYVLQQIPNSLPPRLATKITQQLADMDYVHGNSARIASSVRKVLRYPADNLRVRLEQSVKELDHRRDETVQTRAESERAANFFGDLALKSEMERSKVNDVDLDALPQGAH
ncbi:Dynamin, GTPase domain protein [Cordyceps fumosorosea ARSEF 2679]|uniref:Dynamin, GTPase domain protein n=1 Tax=Cordyceps fumosorosea (strain ARSEF 2679) TaxID=1081104 RepID=A0A167Q429_CORFA|nr:Dynamin, GTPase domain protein [Cordyceps fumosorosea ARSEF 2679]OAA57262.1 Dynamin, GTPase domain protein [Cordyceps fumosorosea ARSEF 2679]